MIQLHPDYLLFQTSEGETIPLPAEAVVVEIVGEQILEQDAELIRNATVAVLHYFKHDLGRVLVTVAEFTQTLEKVLSSLGATVGISSASARAEPKPDLSAVCDLARLAGVSAEGMELIFFPRLRAALRERLSPAPSLLRFQGLRRCVKGLLHAKRWSPRCQSLNDQIVQYLRDCLISERAEACGLMIR